jgi:hypothetical protein
MHTLKYYGLLCGLLATGIFPVAAQPLLFSQFTAGDEGWTVVNWDGLGTTAPPTWYGTGGNPGGYLRSPDVRSDGFWRAPASFHGDWSAAYGDLLSYDIFTLYSNWVMNDVYLVGNGQTLTFKCPTNPPTTWTTFTVRLDATAGWQYGMFYDTNGPAATEAQIRAVLANVTDLRIRQEYGWGSDDCGIDNVGVLSHTQPLRFRKPVVSLGLVHVPLENLQVDRSYRVEQSPTPGATNSWQLTLDFSATNITQTFTLPATNSVMFYRAREQ